jgi:hypothetical protein
MARIIPNENSYIAFLTTIAATTLVPTTAEITSGVNLTPFIISINASMRGNIVQTPSFDNRFETNIPGTITGTFETDMYRDDTTDTAWTTLPRGTSGFFVISRFGGHGTLYKPIIADKVEVWPVRTVARAAANLTNNTAQTFTLQCAVTQVPNEGAVIAT